MNTSASAGSSWSIRAIVGFSTLISVHVAD